jgi:hypothetical protein
MAGVLFCLKGYYSRLFAKSNSIVMLACKILLNFRKFAV